MGWGSKSWVRERFLGLFATAERSAIANEFYGAVRRGADTPEAVVEAVVGSIAGKSYDVATWLGRLDRILSDRRLGLAFASFALAREGRDPERLALARESEARDRELSDRERIAAELRRDAPAPASAGLRGVVPIQTSYRGYAFRSRLEARWAVFFDTIGAAWEYERQGFELPSGRRYLPDFFVGWTGRLADGREETVRAWVEIKGEASASDYSRWAEFASEVWRRDGVSSYYLLGPIPERSVTEALLLPFPKSLDEHQWVAHSVGTFLNAEVAPHLFGWLDSRVSIAAGRPDPYRAARAARFDHEERAAAVRTRAMTPRSPARSNLRF